jgi:hypothetical protein
MTQKPPFAQTIRAKLEELEVEDRIEEVVSEVGELFSHGVTRAGTLVHEHRVDIDTFIDKAAEALDRGLDHRFTSRIDDVRVRLEQGVDRIAEHRSHPDDDAPTEPSAGE